MDIQDEKEQENYNSEEQGEEAKEREEGQVAEEVQDENGSIRSIHHLDCM